MGPDLLNFVLYVGLPLILGAGAYVVKSVLLRISELEEKVNDAVTETQVRQLLGDKIDPIKEDLEEIRLSINKLFELYLKQMKPEK